MSSENDRQIAKEIADKLRSHSTQEIRRVILYGSRAKGTATPESDYDLLVVEADPVAKRDEMRRLRTAFRDFDLPVDVRVMGEEEFEETKGVIGGLSYPAYKYGLVVYENVLASQMGFRAAMACQGQPGFISGAGAFKGSAWRIRSGRIPRSTRR